MKSNMLGGSKFGCLLTLVIMAAIVYVGFQWGYAQWDYETMKEELTLIARSAAYDALREQLNPDAVKQVIISKADQKTDIELYVEDIDVIEREKSVTLAVYWDVPITIPGYTYYLDYSITRTIQKQ